MKRRSFIRNTGAVVALPSLLNGWHIQALAASPLFDSMNTDSDRVLVIVRLNGGNDGLNMLLPLDQYDKLQNSRSNIMMPASNYLDLGNQLNLALHPNMTGVKNLFDNAKLKIVQSVGYPNQNRSHFRSTDIWTSGSPAEEVWTDGWLGRYFDTQFPGYPTDYPNSNNTDPIALSINAQVAETCQGAAGNFSIAVTDPFSLSPLPADAQITPDTTPYGSELSFLYDTLEQTNAYGSVITTAANNGTNMVTYPSDNKLANQLATVARLISGGLQTKVYVVTQGGYDTHADQVQQGSPELGDHAELLSQLSAAIAVFQSDLEMQGLQERVLGMTFSEFGRQIASNFSYGTDHGTAAPLMLFGSCVNAGVTGANPDIPDAPQPQEGVAMAHDFRDVYGSILMDWFDVPQATVEGLLYNGFTYMPVATGCNAPLSINAEQTSVAETSTDLQLSIYPNPMQQVARVSFYSFDEKVRISIFDAMGREVQVLADRNFSSGQHELTWEAHQLQSGNYYCRLKTKHTQQVKRVVKVN